jgi:hypothetical protein
MEDFFIELGRHLQSLNFDQVAQQWRQETLKMLQNSDSKLKFVAKFIELDHGIQHKILYITKLWKSELTKQLYFQIYNDDAQDKKSRQIAISYLLSHDFVHPKMVVDLLYWMENEDDWEAFDILHLHSFVLNTAQRQSLYTWMRNHQYIQETNIVLDVEEPLQPRLTTIYDDHQNVHDSSINDSVWKNIEILQQQYANVKNTTLPDLELNDSQKNALQRIRTDATLFQRDELKITLKDTFNYVVAYILEQSSQLELWDRFCQELDEMAGTCSSGHLARLVNVLVGFHPDIKIEISNYDRIKSSFQQWMQRKAKLDENFENIINQCDDELYNTLQNEKKLIIDFVSRELEMDAQNIQLELEKIWEAMFTIKYK